MIHTLTGKGRVVCSSASGIPSKSTILQKLWFEQPFYHEKKQRLLYCTFQKATSKV